VPDARTSITARQAENYDAAHTHDVTGSAILFPRDLKKSVAYPMYLLLCIWRFSHLAGNTPRLVYSLELMWERPAAKDPQSFCQVRYCLYTSFLLRCYSACLLIDGFSY
jgi:hypothetical protein